MIMILLGEGVVANVNLDKTGMKGAGPVQITIAWKVPAVPSGLLPCFPG